MRVSGRFKTDLRIGELLWVFPNRPQATLGANGHLGPLGRAWMCAREQKASVQHVLRSWERTAAAGCDAPSSPRSCAKVGDRALPRRRPKAPLSAREWSDLQLALCLARRQPHYSHAISHLNHSLQYCYVRSGRNLLPRNAAEGLKETCRQRYAARQEPCSRSCSCAEPRRTLPVKLKVSAMGENLIARANQVNHSL